MFEQRFDAVAIAASPAAIRIGQLKVETAVVADAKTGELLGVHVVGNGAMMAAAAVTLGEAIHVINR